VAAAAEPGDYEVVGESSVRRRESATVGVSVLYQAIPARCYLFARLQRDKAFNALLAALFPYGSGLFHLLACDPDEADEIIEEAIERHEAVLGSEPKARRRVEEFLEAVERTREEFPGIEDRTASLEKCSFDVEARLTRRLSMVVKDSPEFVRKLICGDQMLAPRLRPEGEDILGVVTRPLIRRAAGLLKPLPPHRLFGPDGWEGWCRNEYRRWRRLYLEAAERSEILLVGVA
jgi:hypothetical protein